ncbi:MAG TPA: hypothetical protein VLW47_05150 [Thermodesulfobacteriota bacterium]|nr:hypothetical protein [Thermodesulfobacteriota bacterium]
MIDTDSVFSFMTFVLMVISFGTIIGAIAKRKHRNTWLWKAAGAFGFLVALISIRCFRDLNALSPEDQERSRLKEKIFFLAVIIMFVAGLLILPQLGKTEP